MIGVLTHHWAKRDKIQEARDLPPQTLRCTQSDNSLRRISELFCHSER